MFLQRLILSLIFLGVFGLIVVVAIVLFAALAPISALRTGLALTDNWLLRPLNNLISWTIEAQQLPDRDG